MKKNYRNNEYLTVSFSRDESSLSFITLPGRFARIFNGINKTTNSNNSMKEFRFFCDEYAELTSGEQNVFQELIDSHLVDDKLHSFSDLRLLIQTLDDFMVIENVRNLTDLGERLTEYFAPGEEYEESINEIGCLFFINTKGIFHENGNYYYIANTNN